MTETSSPAEAEVAPAGVNWLRIAFGIICLILGIAALAWPGITLLIIALFFGLELIAAGLVRLASFSQTKGAPGWSRMLTLILGVLTIIAGIICFFRPGASLIVLAWVIGAGWLLDGISELASGLAVSRTFWQRLGQVLFGLASIVAAILLVVWPGQSMVLLAQIGGIFLIVFAVFAMVSGVQARRR